MNVAIDSCQLKRVWLKNILSINDSKKKSKKERERERKKVQGWEKKEKKKGWLSFFPLYFEGLKWSKTADVADSWIPEHELQDYGIYHNKERLLFGTTVDMTDKRWNSRFSTKGLFFLATRELASKTRF